MWYTSIPTTLPSTKVETDAINGFTELTNQFSTSKGGTNIFVTQIASGYTLDGASDAASSAEKVKSEWSGEQYLYYKQSAWSRALKFYQNLNK